MWLSGLAGRWHLNLQGPQQAVVSSQRSWSSSCSSQQLLTIRNYQPRDQGPQLLHACQANRSSLAAVPAITAGARLPLQLLVLFMVWCDEMSVCLQVGPMLVERGELSTPTTRSHLKAQLQHLCQVADRNATFLWELQDVFIALRRSSDLQALIRLSRLLNLPPRVMLESLEKSPSPGDAVDCVSAAGACWLMLSAAAAVRAALHTVCRPHRGSPPGAQEGVPCLISPCVFHTCICISAVLGCASCSESNSSQVRSLTAPGV